MNRINLKAIFATVVVTSLVLTINLLVGAQEQPRQQTNQQKNQQTNQQQTNQTGNSGQMTASASLNSTDRNFVMETAHGSMMEVELGRLASAQGASADVKQFGERMVRDHGAASEELMQIASNKGITLPAGMAMAHHGQNPADASATDQSRTTQDNTTQASTRHGSMNKEHKKVMDKLSGLSGAEFDRAYMREMVKHHEKDVKAFERQASRGTDPDIKAFAAKTLPTLREHLQMAREINNRVNGKTNNKDTRTGR